MQEPIELLQMSLGGLVMVKLRHGRELTGRLVAYDDHLNLMVSDAREKLTTKEKVDDGRGGQFIKKRETNRELQIVYVRGDLVIMVAPL